MPEENAGNIGENIKFLRKTLGLTQQKFAERIGIKQNTIATVESNKRNISEQALLSISREFNVRLNWLKTGEGEMFTKHDPTILERLAAEYDLSDKSRELIENFLKLPPPVRDLVADAVAQAAKLYPRKEEPQPQAQDENDFPKNLRKLESELSAEEAAQTVQYQWEKKEEAEKRGTSTSSASTGLSGASSKNLIDSS